ncbi:MAG TPA: dihydrofolate reductase [Candidatus Paceibacterota bacterium]
MPQTTPNISIIVSVTKTGAIGSHGDLVVRLADDLKRFKEVTSGHPIIMGRKTHESIGRILPARTNYIITRNHEYKPLGSGTAVICTSLDEAIQKAWQEESASKNEKKEIFVIGGGEIFVQALPVTTKIYLTQIDSDLDGDIRFPDYSDFTEEVFRDERTDSGTGIKYTLIDLER